MQFARVGDDTNSWQCKAVVPRLKQLTNVRCCHFSATFSVCPARCSAGHLAIALFIAHLALYAAEVQFRSGMKCLVTRICQADRLVCRKAVSHVMFASEYFPLFLSPSLSLSVCLSPVVRGFVPRPSSPATRREASQSDAVPLRAPRAPFHVPPRQPFHSPFHTERRAEKGRKSREERERSETPFEDEGGLEGKERHRRGGTRSEKTGNSSVGRWFPMTSRRQVTSLEGVRRPSRGQAARCWRRGLMRRLG